MNNSLLVTVANSRDLDSAKQLFFAARFIGKWQGEMCLLCDDKSKVDKNWFLERRILVKRYSPIFKKEDYIGRIEKASILEISTLKYFLFSEDFRIWDTILYLDTDIIINGPISYLSTIKYFGAVSEGAIQIKDLFINQKVPNKNIPIRKHSDFAFNSGVFIFSPKRIPANTFSTLTVLTHKMIENIKYADQTLLNLFFLNDRKKIPTIYNSIINLYSNNMPGFIKKFLFKAHIIHFAGSSKPSHQQNMFHDRWQYLLKNANEKKELFYNITNNSHNKKDRLILVETIYWIIRQKIRFTKILKKAIGDTAFYSVLYGIVLKLRSLFKIV